MTLDKLNVIIIIKKWIHILVLAALVSCSPTTGQGIPHPMVPDYSRVGTVSPGGHDVGFLKQLWEHHPDVVAECYALIDAANVPPGWFVEIHHSGWFPTGASDTGFAGGQVDSVTRTIHLALSQSSETNGPWLPALGHELDHVNALIAGDPNWHLVGH